MPTKKLSVTVVLIPVAEILSKPCIVSLITVLKMTSTQEAAFTQSLISESGDDVLIVVSLLLVSAYKKLSVTVVLIPVAETLSKPCTVSLTSKLNMTSTQEAAFTQGLISESNDDVLMVVSLLLKALRYW